MSEFKYACPVCGQHMMCDSTQSGSVMECPTCFQKIVAPQAPATNDPKFILTGTKFAEKKISTTLANAAASAGAAPEKTFPLAIVLVLALVAAAGAGVLVFREKIFKSSVSVAPTNSIAVAPGKGPKPPKPPEKPALVAPPANDTNWMLTLGTNAIPETPVAGRIHGRDFIVGRASFSTNGTLTIRAGTRNPFDFGLTINFGGAQAAALSGQTLNVTTNADKAAKVTLRWKDASGTVQRDNYDDNYALRLEFGTLANNRLRGKIYLCTPDAEKSYLLGAFNANVTRPKAPPPPKK